MARVDPFIVGFLTIWEIFRDLVVHASDCYFKGAYMYVPILALSKIPRGDKAKSMYPLHKQTIVYCLGSVGRMPHVFHRCKGVARRFCGSLWYKISSTVVVFASTFLVCLAELLNELNYGIITWKPALSCWLPYHFSLQWSAVNIPCSWDYAL